MPDGLPWTIEELERGAHRFTWSSHDGTPFPGLVWKPAAAPLANVLCIHGLSGAACDFGPLGRRLSSEGLAVWAVNLRGQGHDLDHGRRGHFLEPQQWRADLVTFVHTHLDGLPLFVVGESMGSLAAVDAVANGALRPVRLVLSVPVTETRTPVPAWVVALMRRLAGVCPRMKLSPLRFVHGKTALPRLTADDDYMAYLQTIPHRVGGFTLGFLCKFQELMQQTSENAERLDAPTLMLAAGRDVFIRPDQSRSFFERVAAKEKEFVLYPESHHLLWHDVDKADVLDRIFDWIMKGLR